MASRSVVRCVGCGVARQVETKQLTRDAGGCRACVLRKPSAYALVIADPPVRALWLHRYCGIVSRCYDPRHAAYPNYGGRGIRLFPAWRRDRLAFLRYAVTLPGWDNLQLDLDRVDNARGYVPGNLRLCSRSENSRNRRGSVRVCYEGVDYPYEEWRAEFLPGWSTNAARYHLARGRSPEWIVDRYRRTH